MLITHKVLRYFVIQITCVAPSSTTVNVTLQTDYVYIHIYTLFYLHEHII